MKYIYAPWRNHYSDSTEQSQSKLSDESECPFCKSIQSNDDAGHFILKRGAHSYIMFNRYPYNAGHLLIIPYDHIAHLEHLSAQARAEMMELANEMTVLLQKVSKSHGFNIGFNLGKASGGSISEHLHMHVLPRWHGDTNFLLTLDDTKVVSVDIGELYHRLSTEMANK